ncbi:serine acetyltransferase [Acerihabitans sp. KWT182]|uniref:Serine acetyltransferase n=1 Tax=Acerihabitans sp. KWT182 TaxID=3157919 RepID=A0AAU7Q5N0_9GAMM
MKTLKLQNISIIDQHGDADLLTFVNAHDLALQHLKDCLQREVIVSPKPFSWFEVLCKAIKFPARRYHFWWRIANYLYKTGGHKVKKYAIRINRNLRNKYGLDIKLGADIGEGFKISHFVGIVIADCAVIGTNFHITQNVTIGVKETDRPSKIVIGNDVTIGPNSCIIGNDIVIGDNVTIGAMSFINENIPSDSVVYTPRLASIVKMKHPVC